MKDKKLIRTEQHFIDKNHELYKLIDNYCFLSKDLYNYANYIVRQVFITTSKLSRGEEVSKEQLLYLENINKKVDEFNEYKRINYEIRKEKSRRKNKIFNSKLMQIDYFNKDKKYVGYSFLEFLVKDSNQYKSMLAQTSQHVIKYVDYNWVSYFKLVEHYRENKSIYNGVPKIPGYKKKSDRYCVIMTNQACKIRNGYMKFPNCFNNFRIRTDILHKDLREVRIFPKGDIYTLNVIYQIDKKYCDLNYDYICGIDIGVENLATLTNNIGVDPIVINGRVLKSINQYYNKCRSKISSDLMKRHGLYTSNKLKELGTKRFHKINDYMHKSSKVIIDYCIKHSIGTIVIGHNKTWKRNVNRSKVWNQNFVHIPFNLLIDMIKYKGEDVGINVIESEERYTSGTSFVDNEYPCKESYDSSRRVKRGLFKSNEGIYINSDVNGSYQIIKKVVPDAFANGIEGAGLHPVRVNIY